MTDPVIPPEAVEATSEAICIHGAVGLPWGPSECGCGETFKTAVERQRHASRAVLAAALPHLRPLVEAETKKLRQELVEEIAVAFERGLPVGEGMPIFSRESDRLTASRMVRGYARKIRLSTPRDTGKGDS